MCGGAPVLLALALAAAGCYRPPLGADGGGAGGASVDDAGRAVCPSPAGCNEDPTMSALAGTCVPHGEYWYCQCSDGFSINPKTQRCRAGTACVAAAADEWDFQMIFDVSDCAARAPTACEAPTHGSQSQVNAELLALPGPKCMLPSDLTIRVEVEGGCPTVLEARAPGATGSLAAFYLDYVHCVADAIGGVRLACGAASDCLMAEWDTLVP